MTTYSGIRLDLVGEEHGEVEFLRELLQSREELIEFLRVRIGLNGHELPVVARTARLDQNSLVLRVSKKEIAVPTEEVHDTIDDEQLVASILNESAN